MDPELGEIDMDVRPAPCHGGAMTQQLATKGTGICPTCQQSVPIRDWCIVDVHTYTVEGRPVICPGVGAIQHMVSRGQLSPRSTKDDPPKKRTCSSCGGSGQVKSGRDKTDLIIWVTCASSPTVRARGGPPRGPRGLSWRCWSNG
jgi:hypothetical protein